MVNSKPVKKHMTRAVPQNKTSTTKYPLIKGSDLLYILFKQHPEIKYILLKHKIYSGIYTHYDTLEGRAVAHGLTAKELTTLLDEINVYVRTRK